MVHKILTKQSRVTQMDDRFPPLSPATADQASLVRLPMIPYMEWLCFGVLIAYLATS